MDEKIICKTCNEEITSFRRVCTGIIEDQWCLNDDELYEFERDINIECQEVDRLICNNCGTTLDDETCDLIFEQMY